MVAVELRAVFGGTADSRGCGRQNTRAVSTAGSGAALHVGCAGWRELVVYTPATSGEALACALNW